MTNYITSGEFDRAFVEVELASNRISTDTIDIARLSRLEEIDTSPAGRNDKKFETAANEFLESIDLESMRIKKW